MKKLAILLSLAAVAAFLPACTTVEAPTPTTTSTTETTEVHRAPVGAASTTTTVRSY
jgi:hypothetical protein